MNNLDVRQYASNMGVKLWEIAYRLNLQDSNFSRKLRKELPDDEKERLKKLIAVIAAEKRGE